MGLAVLTHQTGAVHREDHGQRLDGAVVDDVVVRALKEGGVDGAHRTQPARCETGGEGDGVPLRDADIEEPVGMCRGKQTDTGAARHRRGDRDDACILARELRQSLAEGRRIRWIRGDGRPGLAGARIVSRREGMPLLAAGVLASGKSLSLLGDDVDEARSIELAHHREGLEQRVDVVAIDRAEVSEAELLEQHTGGEEGFHALLPLPHDRSDRTRGAVHELADLRADPVVERIALDRRQVLVHRADVWRDRHLVVVEDDHDVAIRVARVVETFVREPAAQRAVAEHGHHFQIVLALDVARRRHPERSRDGRGGVARAEGVVLALRALQEAGDPAFLPQRLHLCVAPGEQLVRIALMADVPYELVARRSERGVERDRELDHAEAGADVAARARDDVDEPCPHLVGERAKLVAGEGAKVGGRGDTVEE